MKKKNLSPNQLIANLLLLAKEKKTRKICTLSESYWFYLCLALDAIVLGLMARIAIEGGKGWPTTTFLLVLILAASSVASSKDSPCPIPRRYLRWSSLPKCIGLNPPPTITTRYGVDAHLRMDPISWLMTRITRGTAPVQWLSTLPLLIFVNTLYGHLIHYTCCTYMDWDRRCDSLKIVQ